MHCNRFISPPLSRREMLLRCANGFGAVALASLLSESAAASSPSTPPLSARPSHFSPKAKSVIFLYMDGGPSQIDTFDPKPRLDREHGQPMRMRVEPTQFNNVGTIMRCPWRFRRYGQSGLPVSDLFPNVATCVDDLCILRSLHGTNPAHGGACLKLHTGSDTQV